MIVNKYGPPPLWHRPPGFETLLYIILEQQVSLTSARATYRKLKEYTGSITPQNFIKLDDLTLRKLGFSRQKTLYGRELAKSLISGRLDLDKLAELEGPQIRKALKSIKGIGDWTADIYLIETILHPDIWPAGDLAMMKSYQKLKRLKTLPQKEEAIRIGEKYKPWRSVAARLLWHYYINKNNLKVEFELIK